MRKNAKIYIVSLLFVALASGCTAIRLIKSTKIKEPEIKYVNHTVGDPSLKKVPIYVTFNAHNPNEIGLKNVFVSYELFIEGKRFLKGDDISILLVPNGDTKIVVPAEVIYSDVFRALGPVAEKVLLGYETLPVLASIEIQGTPTVYNEVEEGAIFSFKFKTSKLVQVPIPQDKVNEAKDKLKSKVKELRKLF